MVRLDVFCHHPFTKRFRVYDISLLSSLPQSILPLLPSEERPPLRTRPLFNVGIHDIPYLSSLDGPHVKSGLPSGWIACTTDNVLTMKSYLYDVLVTLPPRYCKNSLEKVYPSITIVPEEATLAKKTHDAAPLHDMPKKMVLAKDQIGDFYKDRFAEKDSELTTELGKLAAGERHSHPGGTIQGRRSGNLGHRAG